MKRSIPPLLIGNAESFLSAATIIKDHFSSKGEDLVSNVKAAPFYYLVAQAAELTLKHALLAKGCGEEELMKPEIRHNLNKLMRKCKENGVDLSADFETHIGFLSENHADHTLRFMKPNMTVGGQAINAVIISTPDPDLIIDLVSRKISELKISKST